MRKLIAFGVMAAGLGMAAPTQAVTFTSFVSSSDIASVLGQSSTIAFNYAGNKFVGSVYFGPNNDQLFSTDLTGHNVHTFGPAIPAQSGEVVVGASLGHGGFALGDIYTGSGAGGAIYHIPNSGASENLFATLPGGSGDVRQIFFDPGSSFGGDMLVTTSSGTIYKVSSGGVVSVLASVGEDTEGMDLASSSFGKYAGQLLVSSEGSGTIRAITAGGVISVLKTATGNVAISEAETVSTVPLDLGLSGNPIEGFYVANYPVDIQKAGASEFAGLQGDTIVTSEFGSNSTLTDLHYNGDALGTFTLTPVGALPNQSEDGIFVTADRINDFVPEPSAWVLMLVGFGSVGGALRRRGRALRA